jgi:hypothetical protein
MYDPVSLRCRNLQRALQGVKLQRGPNHLAKSLAVLSCGERPNGSKEGLGTLGGRGRKAYELGRARKPGAGERKLEKNAEGRGRNGERGGGIYGRRESSEARASTPCLVRRLLNLGGQTPRL